MTPEEEFLEREVSWVRQVRKTRNPEMLHLVEPAVAREREIFSRLGELRNGPELRAVNFAERDEMPEDDE